MGGVLLLFAFTMSLLINFVEKRISQTDEQRIKRKMEEENVITESE
jgi:hypothetical protein